jgi:hypothetical protein
MARPIKESLNYFPLDTGFFGDRKIKRLLKTFGGKGTTIYTFLLCEIYRENGYFLKWDEHYPEDIADALGAGFTPSLVSEVLSLCLKIDLLDNNLFGSFSILTSAGIQKRYVSAKETINRKQYQPDELLVPEYNLISEISGSLTPLNDVERRKTSLTAVTTLKGNESKRKERKVKEKKNFAQNAKDDSSTTSSKNTFDASQFLPGDEQIETPAINLDDGKITASQKQINQFLKAIGAAKCSETEKMAISRAIEAGCTLEHLEQLLKDKPNITSFKADWVIRELIAVKRKAEAPNDSIFTDLKKWEKGEL